jgi:carbonic anhydrase/acetyltransferase-like protein (isoleucine patch superfamily)
MRIEHAGKRPVIDPTAVVVPTAIISGDVHVGAGTVVFAGAIITSQGAPVHIGQHCIVMEHAVIRGAGSYPCTLGNHVLVGPHTHIAGATVNGRAFIATGASVFNGAVLEEGVLIASNAVVHIATRCLAGTGVPMGHIAFGDPATVYAPHDAPAVHAPLSARGFAKAVFGLDAQRLADAGTIEQLCARYARALGTHRDDHIVAEE